MFHVKHGQDHRLLYTSQKSPTGVSPRTNRYKKACLSVLFIIIFSVA